MANHYDVPNWAGKPPVGLHLDVLKGDKLIQKLMVDQKKCYLFGRNPQMNDFCIDHQSCSRVHAAFVYHKHLHRAFLVDLGSTHGTYIGSMRVEADKPTEIPIDSVFHFGASTPHGTYIGSMRVEADKPTQLPIDSVFHFGASTRNYIIRERPQTGSRPIIEELEKSSEDAEGGLLGLPETETELDNLTEFNTAHNRRISMLGIGEDGEATPRKRKRTKRGVTFNEDEEIINPEDVDPSVGRFRNLIHSTVIPTKRQRLESGVGITSGLTQPEEHKTNLMKHLHPSSVMSQLYQDIPGPESQTHGPTGPATSLLFSSALASRLGIALPNPAPDVDMAPPIPVVPQPEAASEAPAASNIPEPKKKKYAKEAWPGKKPGPTLLL